MFSCKILPRGETDVEKAKDISNYVVSYDWSGDVGQAARKLEFSIAYNTKDKGFDNLGINLGNMVYLYYQKDVNALGPVEKPQELFRGKIFYKDRRTAGFTFEFTAYDDMIFLAKSKTTLKFSGMTVTQIFEQLINELGIQKDNNDFVTIDVQADFVADNMSYTEIMQKALSLAYAQNGKKYHFFLQCGLFHLAERSKAVDGYTATDTENVEATEHSESIEDMVSTVMIVNAEGEEIGRISSDDDIKNYGKIQEIYKEDPKQDTATAAKAMLKTVAYKSTLSAIGNPACIAGRAIVVQEEQLKGKFAIKSDHHTISGGVHKMELDLEFIEMVGEKTK